MIRIQLLEKWLNRVLEGRSYRYVPLAGDASFRRYFRVFVESSNGFNDQVSQQYVAMDAPPPENIHPFIEIAGLLSSLGLSVPRILHQEQDLGFLLLSDLGDRLYLHELNEGSAESLYRDALSSLIRIQSCQATLPKFNRVFMWDQLQIFQTWYLEKHLGLGIKEIENNLAQLKPLLSEVIQTIEGQPYVVIHRDYHSRNLMILDSANPGIIDFQDAMLGPVTYDLVSLFQDCYISWDRAQVQKWVLDFQMQARAAGILKSDISHEQFLQWFDWTGLHRHLKNLGIFTRLYHRDGKPGYLKDIPIPLKYIKETCGRYPRLTPLWTFFENTLKVKVEV